MNDFDENLEDQLDEDELEEEIEEEPLEEEVMEDSEDLDDEGEPKEISEDEPKEISEDEPKEISEDEPEEGEPSEDGDLEEISEEELIEGATEEIEGELSEERSEELGEDGLAESGDMLDEETEEEQAARIERQHRDLQRNQIEASLYAAGKPLSIEILSTKLEIPKKKVEELLNELAFDYLDRSTSLVIAQMGDRYQMQIKPEYTEKVSTFAEGGAIAERYLRTLTIIALKQPIMKSMLIKLRGSGAYEHVKYLTDNELIEGTKKGRSVELMTTDKYAEMFGLPKDRDEMKRMMISQLGLGDEQGENSQ